MGKFTACLDISSDSIKLLIGYDLPDKPVVLARKEVPFPGLIRDGAISDPAGLVRELAALHLVEDPVARVRIDITEVCLLLPPIGLTVYQDTKTTNVVSPTNEIAKIDISNVISLVKKEAIPSGNEVVDIIPDQFVLDDGRRFADPPLGELSSSLTIDAKIHTLPESVVNAYKHLLTQAGFRVKKVALSDYCVAKLLQTYGDLPSTYLLADMGAGMTSVSLIGDHSLIAAASFFDGGGSLTEAIASAFECSYEEAERLKVHYGYKPKKRAYNPPLPFDDEHLAKSVFYQEDLNAVIASYYESYMAKLANAANSLTPKFGGSIESLPIVFVGGGSALRGIEGFLKGIFPRRELHFVTPRSIGARIKGHDGLLGLLLLARKYTGSLEDNHRGMGTVSRLPKEKKPGKAKSGPDTDAL